MFLEPTIENVANAFGWSEAQASYTLYVLESIGDVTYLNRQGALFTTLPWLQGYQSKSVGYQTRIVYSRMKPVGPRGLDNRQSWTAKPGVPALFLQMDYSSHRYSARPLWIITEVDNSPVAMNRIGAYSYGEMAELFGMAGGVAGLDDIIKFNHLDELSSTELHPNDIETAYLKATNKAFLDILNTRALEGIDTFDLEWPDAEYRFWWISPTRAGAVIPWSLALFYLYSDLPEESQDPALVRALNAAEARQHHNPYPCYRGVIDALPLVRTQGGMSASELQRFNFAMELNKFYRAGDILVPYTDKVCNILLL